MLDTKHVFLLVSFQFSESPNFQFSSTHNFLSHKLEDPSCRICSYGPHGPCWFSVKHRPDMETRYNKWKLGKVTFWDYRENELIHRRYIFKSPPMLGSTPQGLLFLINIHFWNFRTCPFWRNCTFAHIWSECPPRHY